MADKSMNKAAIPNPALKPFSILIGEWETVGKHRLIEGTLHGRTTFSWIEGGAFLMMRTEIDEPQVPSASCIIGSDDALQTFFMLYFDERGVSRKFEVSISDKGWKHWRNAPGFSQRFTGTFADNGDTINSMTELSEDDATWKNDLELTFTRVK